jgi:hypothetical protein
VSEPNEVEVLTETINHHEDDQFATNPGEGLNEVKPDV